MVNQVRRQVLLASALALVTSVTACGSTAEPASVDSYSPQGRTVLVVTVSAGPSALVDDFRVEATEDAHQVRIAATARRERSMGAQHADAKIERVRVTLQHPVGERQVVDDEGRPVPRA